MRGSSKSRSNTSFDAAFLGSSDISVLPSPITMPPGCMVNCYAIGGLPYLRNKRFRASVMSAC
jgi:hypothetical protein